MNIVHYYCKPNSITFSIFEKFKILAKKLLNLNLKLNKETIVGLVNSVTKFKNLYAYKKWKYGLLCFFPVVLNFERGCTNVSI